MNDFMPITGWYSWLREGSCAICSRILGTTEETQGWPSWVMQTVWETTGGVPDSRGLQVCALQTTRRQLLCPGFLRALENCLREDNFPYPSPLTKRMCC